MLEWWGIDRRSLEASCFRWRSRKWFLPQLRARDLLHWRISRGGRSWLCYKIGLHNWFVSLSTYNIGSEPGVWTLDLAYGTHHTAMEPVIRACVRASRLQHCAPLLLWWEQTGCHSPFVWLKVPAWPWWCCKAFMSPSLENTNELDYSPCSCPGSCYALVLILWTKHLWKKLISSKFFKCRLHHSSLLGTPRISLFKMSPLVLFCEQDLWHVTVCVMHAVRVTGWVDRCIVSVIHLCTFQFKCHLEGLLRMHCTTRKTYEDEGGGPSRKCSSLNEERREQWWEEGCRYAVGKNSCCSGPVLCPPAVLHPKIFYRWLLILVPLPPSPF